MKCAGGETRETEHLLLAKSVESENLTSTVENLRAELRQYGVDAAKLDEKDLSEMLDKVSGNRKFVVALADLKAGTGLKKGKTEALTPQQAKSDGKKSKK